MCRKKQIVYRKKTPHFTLNNKKRKNPEAHPKVISGYSNTLKRKSHNDQNLRIQLGKTTSCFLPKVL